MTDDSDWEPNIIDSTDSNEDETIAQYIGLICIRNVCNIIGYIKKTMCVVHNFISNSYLCCITIYKLGGKRKKGGFLKISKY